MSCEIPARRGGDGHFPLPGWDPSFDWDGLIPSSSLPRVEDPPEGFVASANDDWSTAGQHLPYPGDFASGARIGRIREVLASSRGVTVESFRALEAIAVALGGIW